MKTDSVRKILNVENLIHLLQKIPQDATVEFNDGDGCWEKAYTIRFDKRDNTVSLEGKDYNEN